MNTGQQAWKSISTIYWLVVFVHLVAIAIPILPVQYSTKPLLMPLLILGLNKAISLTVNNNRLILFALLLSWVGDVLLMLAAKDELFFIAGLVSFLCAHILYILYFLRIKGAQPSLLKKRPVLIIVALAYGMALVSLLYPSLGPLRIPVLVYACVIVTMLLCCLQVYLRLPQKVAQLFAIGAAFFVLSDSLLAIDKFYTSFPLAGVAIMLTYCIAQYCIASGAVARRLDKAA